MFILHVMFRDAFGIGQKIYTNYTYYMCGLATGTPQFPRSIGTIFFQC